MCRAFIKNILLLVIMQCLLAGCSMFAPVKTQPTSTYVLNTLPRPVVKKQARRMNIMVMEPVASSLYATSQMAYSVHPYKIAYFANNSWADTPSQMLQSLLVQTLQDTHYFHSVGVPSVLGRYDYAVSTQLLNFEQQFFGRSSEEVVTVRVQVIKMATNQIVAAKQFTVSEMAPENTPYGGVVAANQAVAKVLEHVTRFCLKSVG